MKYASMPKSRVAAHVLLVDDNQNGLLARKSVLEEQRRVLDWPPQPKVAPPTVHPADEKLADVREQLKENLLDDAAFNRSNTVTALESCEGVIKIFDRTPEGQEKSRAAARERWNNARSDT